VKALLDACVLYPTVMREMLLEVAARGGFQPLWTARLLREWERAAARRGEAERAQAQGEIALLATQWPQAMLPPPPESLARRLWLPDPSDVHVLAAAIAGSADVIVTVNAQDFPRGVLAEEGLSRADPDAFLLGLWKGSPAIVEEAAQAVRVKAEALSGGPWEMRRLLKKARLPRLGKALSDV
jgi:predicted nucleic acid-binding protein